jgi:glycosyltransferase involved in cell wall biosynthesis
LADGRGILVAPGSPADLADALNDVLGDDALRAALGRQAYEYSRQMVWSSVGRQYRNVFERVTIDPIVPAPISPMWIEGHLARSMA